MDPENLHGGYSFTIERPAPANGLLRCRVLLVDENDNAGACVGWVWRNPAVKRGREAWGWALNDDGPHGPQFASTRNHAAYRIMQIWADRR